MRAVSSRQCRVTNPKVTFNRHSHEKDFGRVLPAACRRSSSAQSAIRSLRWQGDKKAKSVGRRQGNRAAHSF